LGTKDAEIGFLHLETQANVLLHVSECNNEHGKRDNMKSQTERDGMNQAGTRSGLPSFIFIGKLLNDF
jgi:hypothetical protein